MTRLESTHEPSQRPDKSAAYLAADDFTQSDESQNMGDQARARQVSPELRFPKTRRPWLFWSLLLVAIAATAQTAYWVVEAWQQHWVLGLLWSLGLGLAVLLILRTVIKEWWNLRQLKRRWHHRDTLLREQQSIHPERLLKELKRDDLVVVWQQGVEAHWNAAEVQQRFEEDIVAVVDEQAQRLIRRAAGEAALVIAASPSALLDMALLMWRNQRLISKIADVYGIRLGYWSRLRLWKQLLTNVVYAGASELAMDAGTVVLSAELAGKFSARVAQGLGAGLLTGRLGLQAQRLCRPVPYVYTQQASLGQIQRQLLSELKQQLPKLFVRRGTVSNEVEK